MRTPEREEQLCRWLWVKQTLTNQLIFANVYRESIAGDLRSWAAVGRAKSPNTEQNACYWTVLSDTTLFFALQLLHGLLQASVCGLHEPCALLATNAFCSYATKCSKNGEKCMSWFKKIEINNHFFCHSSTKKTYQQSKYYGKKWFCKRRTTNAIIAKRHCCNNERQVTLLKRQHFVGINCHLCKDSVC